MTLYTFQQLHAVQTLGVDSDHLLSSPRKGQLLLDIERYVESGVRLPWRDVVIEALVVDNIVGGDEPKS